MSRLILIIVIIALVYWLLKSSRNQQRKQDEPTRTQDMVSCARCGINLPKSESLLVGGKTYCCAEHSRSQDGKQSQ